MNDYRLPKKTRLPADGNLHRVVLGLNVETLLLKSLEDSDPSMESLHALLNSTTHHPASACVSSLIQKSTSIAAMLYKSPDAP